MNEHLSSKNHFPYNGDVNTDIIDFLDTLSLDHVLIHLSSQQLNTPLLTDNSIATLLISGYTLKVEEWLTNYKPTSMLPIGIFDELGAFVGWAKIPNSKSFLNAVGAYSHHEPSGHRNDAPRIGDNLVHNIYFIAGWQLVHVFREVYDC